MRSETNLANFISHLALHVPHLHSASKHINIEPALIAYFSSLTRVNISKDALSKVTKTFFKELKMYYRKLGADFVSVLTNLSNFFAAHES